jgi:hypothetical protein
MTDGEYTAIAASVAAVCSVLNNFISYLASRRADVAAKKADVAAQAVQTNGQVLKELHYQTNGLVNRVIEATSVAAGLQGEARGKAAEQESQAASAVGGKSGK